MQSFEIEHNRLLGDLKVALGKDIVKLSVMANGGRSILFVYPPQDEEKYITEAKNIFSETQFIDLRKLFVEFVDSYEISVFKESYKEFKNEIFWSNNFDDTFYELIKQKIGEAFREKKIPVLIHTGIIYSMGFSNINIMEESIVIKSQIPLVVFYPATIENNKIMFLGKQPASPYRCIVVK